MADGWEIAGTVADSVAGLGTLGALIVATTVYLRQQEDARRAQASRVVLACWNEKESNAPQVRITVRNDSDLPIFDVVIIASGAKLVVGEYVGWDQIEPGQHAAARYEWERGVEFSAAVLFIDAGGRHWERRFSGALRRSHFR
jgi:membrane-bound inhibitor of C-type lysozyme